MESLLLPHLGTVLGFLLALVAIGHMLQRPLSPAATSAWLIVMVSLPYVGVPLYLAFGSRKLDRQGLTEPDLAAARVTAVSQPGPIDELMRALGQPGASEGNHVEILGDGEQAYAALMGLIEEAKESIQLHTFILHPDKVGRAVRDRLVEAARDGISVRVLLDSVGSLTTSRRFLSPIENVGGRVAFFNPLLHRVSRGHSNLRNHRKILLVDGEKILSGGTNIASEYIGPGPSSDRWRDLTFLLQGDRQNKLPFRHHR